MNDPSDDFGLLLLLVQFRRVWCSGMVQIVMQTQMEALQVGEMPKREDVAAFHKMTHIAVNSLLRVFL